jgi:hypothetical protein
MLVYNWVYTTPAMGIGGAIFFGYSSALLGISGFESSSNYVENQKPGVFPKTLRNMWVSILSEGAAREWSTVVIVKLIFFFS